MYCISCGKEIINKRHVRGKYTDGKSYFSNIWICESPQCTQFYTTNLIISHDVFNNSRKVDGFCRVCGKPFILSFGTLDRIYKHIGCQSKKNRYYYKPWKAPTKITIVEKPWEDPESLFCDTAFLDMFVGKKVARCEEVKG